MKFDELNFRKYLDQLSTRHHYIPQFLINGFVNSDGLIYIYDKSKDRILKNPRSPKSVFFENNRNTIELKDTGKSSAIEDLHYLEIDNATSKVIKQYQTNKLSEIDFGVEDTAIMLFFLITLFWRIPKTDFAAKDVLDRSTINGSLDDVNSLKNEEWFRKLSRAGLFKHHIDEIRKFGIKGKKFINIHQNQLDVYVLGDYPFLLRNPSANFGEFNNSDILIAISSNRIYSSTNSRLNNFGNINSLRYNACIIEQSVKYVACGNLEILKQSIFFYKKLKELGLIYSFKERVFETREPERLL